MVATFSEYRGANDCRGAGESDSCRAAPEISRAFYDEIRSGGGPVTVLYATTTPGGSLVPRATRSHDSVLTGSTSTSGYAGGTGGGGNLGYVLLLDADYLPVYSGSFDLAPEETIQPGATGTISHGYLPYFPGRATRLRAFLQFD
jgi:hypothetical protein